MIDKHIEQAVKAVRAIANMIEADPGCFEGLERANRLECEYQGEAHQCLVQEFTIHLKHYVFVPLSKRVE